MRTFVLVALLVVILAAGVWAGMAFLRVWFDVPTVLPTCRDRFGIHHLELYESYNYPKGFLLNDKPFTTGLPDSGSYYPVDIWFPEMVGIKPEKALPVVEKCGELLLPQDSRNLFVVV